LLMFTVGANCYHLNWAGRRDGNAMQYDVLYYWTAGRETTAGVTAAGGIKRRKAPHQPRLRSLRYLTRRIQYGSQLA
jgi:hypothetical protein